MLKQLGVLLFMGLVASSSAIAAPVADNSSVNASKGEIAAKLDRIAKNNEEILKRLDEMKEELYVIKIRASR